MTALTKKQKVLQSKIDRSKIYSVAEALNLAKECATAKFDESVDIAVSLGIDPRKSDQAVRGSVLLPAGTGKTVRVAVFAQGDKAEAAKAAGVAFAGVTTGTTAADELAQFPHVKIVSRLADLLPKA